MGLTELSRDRARRGMMLFLVLLTVASFAGFQGWRTLLNNFAVDTVGLSGAQIGVIQSVREIPGFLSLLVVYLLLIISEHRLAALSVLILGLGVGLTGPFPSFWGVMGTTVLMSFGFHYFETLNQSLTLQYFDRDLSPLVFGRLRSIGSMTNIATGAAIWLAADSLSYTQMYAGLGVFVAALALGCLLMDPRDRSLPPQHKKMVFRRRYWLYYVLTFLAGARRQVFVAFAIYLLVSRFGYTVREVTMLFVVNNVVNTLASPMVGRAVRRFGERKVLSLEYAGLILVFATYAFTDSKLVAAAAYIVDHLLFGFAMAIRTFFQKIADPADIAPSMAVGFTINHVAAVVIPALGGLVWMADYRLVFLAGAALSLCSLVMTQWIDICLKNRAEESGPA